MVLAATGVRRVESTPSLDDLDTKRLLSLLAGGALAAYGLSRRDIPGAILAIAGGALLAQGATGRNAMDLAKSLRSTNGAGGQDGTGSHNDHLSSNAATVNARRAIKVERSIAVSKPARQLYDLWRNFENLPRFMDHLESVTQIDEMRSHWVAKGPAGVRVEWDAELVNDRPGELIAWKTIGNPDIAHAGSVHFMPAANGTTEVRFIVDYEPPGGRFGAIGASISRIFGESPDQRVRADLERFARIAESS